MPFRPFIPQSQVWVYGGNGYGSTNTKIRRWSTAKVNTGTAITYADSSTNGASFTINESGVYAIFRSDYLSSAAAGIGLSINSNQLTTGVGSISAGHFLNFVNSGAAFLIANVVWTGYLVAGDVIRGHDHTTVCDGTGNITSFGITKVTDG